MPSSLTPKIRVLHWLCGLITLAVIATSGCNSPDQSTTANMPAKPTIIFIPGYYGSVLKQSSSNKRVWLTAGEALFGHKTLALNDKGLDIPGADSYKVDGVLKQVALLFGLFNIDAYGDFLTQLQALENFDVIPFAYDWRRDNMLAVEKLAKLIEQLKQRQPDKKIILVAHSMGGLITSYYLRYGSQAPENAVENWTGAKNIDKVVMAAVPFRGVMVVFRNMQTGAKFGLNTTLMNAQAVASFDSSYQTLFLDPQLLLNNQLQPFAGAHDIKKWRQHKWGLLNNTTKTSDEAMNLRLRFVEKSLQTSRQFLNLINAPINHNINKSVNQTKLNTKILYIHSNGHSTLEKMIVDEQGQTSQLIYSDEQVQQKLGKQNFSLFSAGDGTVTTESSRLPQAYQNSSTATSIILTTAEHSKIYNDKNTLDALLRFIRAAH